MSVVTSVILIGDDLPENLDDFRKFDPQSCGGNKALQMHLHAAAFSRQTAEEIVSLVENADWEDLDRESAMLLIQGEWDSRPAVYVFEGPKLKRILDAQRE